MQHFHASSEAFSPMNEAAPVRSARAGDLISNSSGNIKGKLLIQQKSVISSKIVLSIYSCKLLHLEISFDRWRVCGERR